MDGLNTGATDFDVERFVTDHPRGTPEFLHAAMRGVLLGVRRVVFGGYNEDVDVATVPEDIWPIGGLIPRPTGNESWEIVSSSANDTAAGTGCRTVTLTTLDTNYVETTQTISLNGVTPVAIPGNCRFINAGRALTPGSLGKVDGTLTIQIAGGGAARGAIPTDGFLNQAKFTVPAGYSLDLHSLVMGIRTQGGTESALFSIVTTNSAGLSLTAVRFPAFASGVSFIRHEVASGVVPFVRLPEKTEFNIRGMTVSQNNTVLDASLLGFLYQNSIWP